MGCRCAALAQGAAQLLAPGGSLSVVLPVLGGEAAAFGALARAAGLRLVSGMRRREQVTVCTVGTAGTESMSLHPGTPDWGHSDTGGAVSKQ